MVKLFPITIIVFLINSLPAAAENDLEWKADYFPGFADADTVALWLFDETPYRYNTITDAGIHEYDLRLLDGNLVPGQYGNALRTIPGPDFNLSYAAWAGKVSQEQMRRPDGEPSGHWGPTMAPDTVLSALAKGDWTIECRVNFIKRPNKKTTLFDLGHGYDPGFEIALLPIGKTFHLVNAYAGLEADCPTALELLFDGQWHHLAFTWSGEKKQLRHFLDGREQSKASLSSVSTQPVPAAVLPTSFVKPEGYGLFDSSMDYEKFRRHRFNLSLGENRRGLEDMDGMIDEFRISRRVRYAQSFSPPLSLSRNYGLAAPQPAVANGPPLLFAPDSSKGIVLLGSRKYVFLDDALLEKTENLAFVSHPPRIRQPLNFRPDESRWRPSVVDVEGKVYMYFPESYGSDFGNTHLRISEDGLNFSIPDLGLWEFNGSAHNDFIISLNPLYANFFKDLNPAASPEEQYKMTAWLSNRGIYLYLSPDGIHWRRNEAATLPIISGGDAETYWDDQRGLYVTFLRRDASHYTEAYPGHGRAGVYFATREVFKTWPFRKLEKPYFEGFSIPAPTGEGKTIFVENETGQVYRTRAIKYPWAPDAYFAFPWRFRAEDETRRVDLGVSRDGLHWKFFAREQWYVAPPKGSREVLSVYGLIRRGDEIWQYIDYGGPHGRGEERTYARLKQRLDGFVSLKAEKGTGIALTRPLIFKGNRLLLNVSSKGNVGVEIENEKGVALSGYSLEDCDPVKVDAIRHTVTWRKSPAVGDLAGRVVRLKLELTKADLYALRFREEAEGGEITF